jgi:DNA-binding LacI/PurR family transcriptional regulator
MGLSPVAGCLVGGAAGLAAVVIFDRRRWGAMESYFAWTDDPAAVQQAVRRLTDAGFAVRYYTSPDGEPALVYRQRDQRRVMRELGLSSGA